MQEDKKEMGNLQAIKLYFGMTLEEMKVEVLPLSEAERAELGAACREVLKAEQTGQACVA